MNIDDAIIEHFAGEQTLVATGDLYQDRTDESAFEDATEVGRFTYSLIPGTARNFFDGDTHVDSIVRFTGFCTSKATLDAQQRLLIDHFHRAPLDPEFAACLSFTLQSFHTRYVGLNKASLNVYQSVTDFRAKVEF